MHVVSVTVGLPVSDLTAARTWYQIAFELGEPDLVVDDDMVEYDLGPVWLQLAQLEEASDDEPDPGLTHSDAELRQHPQSTLRLGVRDVHRERARLVALGIPVPDVEHVPGLIDYLDFTDPDGNALSLYTVLAPEG